MGAQSQGRARAKGTKRTKAQAMAYLALHGTDLARAIAAGAIHSHPLRAEQGRAPVFVDAGGIAQALADARQGKDYGVFALVEIAWERRSTKAADGQPLVDSTASYIPLALVSRILFQSLGDRAEFLARASGYGDVPVEVMQYDVEPALFTQAAPGLFREPGTDQEEDARPEPDIDGARVMDRLAGAASAYLAAMRGLPGAPHIAVDFEAACKESAGEGTPGAFIRALALRGDPSTDTAVNADILAMAAKTLASVELSAGFDADAFLASFVDTFEPGSDAERIARKFVDRAQAVLSGSTELAGDAFADSPGKTILRALLLFLLNPDASRLQSIGKRLGILGPSVQMLASSLAGCLAGFSSLPGTLKAPGRDTYLAVPLLAQSLSDGSFAGFATTTVWGEEGSGEYRLSLERHPIFVHRLSPSNVIIELGAALKGMGLAPLVDKGSGFIYWQDPEVSGVTLRARPCSTPVFPSRDGVEIHVIVQTNRPRRELVSLVASINTKTKMSGVFGAAVIQGKRLDLELSVICDSFEKSVVERALKVLGSEVANNNRGDVSLE